MRSVGEECTQEVADLLDICMRTNVDERPSAKEIVAALQVCRPFCHPIFCHTLHATLSSGAM